MEITEIRSRFIKYFEKKSHKFLPSSSLVPHDDPTLLFINAGMAQFKDEFTGKSNPENKRVVTIQKCVRAGGKHNDLENVGFTARHHTFFEMMGNFSFGDYFKNEAISMAWEFLTKELGISKDKLYVTVHHTDQEAADIWHEQENVPKDRIFFRGDKDNFWEMGDIGPCGPSSEIFYDHGPDHTDPKADTSTCILDDEDRYVEIWNLVFMQFEKYKQGGKVLRRELPKPCVDTGAGLERIGAVMQGLYNNFDTTGFMPVINEIEKISNKSYRKHPKWMRVVADHARSATMLLADGVIPSNEGRGYVLRRIIRRAVRYLDLLGVEKTLFYTLSKSVIESLGPMYREALKNLEFVQKYLELEEDSFRRTLSSGLKLLEKKMGDLKNGNDDTLSGADAFLLYDTHGFPLDLTQMILEENSLKLDEAGFEKQMNLQKERSKKGSDFSGKEDDAQKYYAIKEGNGETEFLGYELTETVAILKGIVEGEKFSALIFDKTPFYGEGGGQSGDAGKILDGDEVVAHVLDTQRPIEGLFSHIVKDASRFEIGKSYKLAIDVERRNLIMCNHTATHLLQAALIEVLGSHIKQAGSYVGEDRLRFDFTHPQGMSKGEIKNVEKIVNDQIKKSISVCAENMTKDQALKKGAMALFGEKYGDEVRVIDIPGFSVELCGGTHVKNTQQISQFKILSESSLASGIRRIEAATSMGAIDYSNEKIETLEKLESAFKVKGQSLVDKILQLQESHSESLKTIKSLKDKIQSMNSEDMFKNVLELSNGLSYKYINISKEDDIRKVGDLFIDKYPKGVVLLTQDKGGKVAVLLKTFKGNSDFNCSVSLKDAFSQFAGKGGGRPDMAQGSLDNKSDVEKFVKSIEGSFA